MYFVTPDQERVLRQMAIGDRSDEEIAVAMTGQPFDRMNDWTLVRAAVHQEITEWLKTERSLDQSHVQPSESFDFNGQEASAHAADILHAYSVATGQIEVRPVPRNLSEDVHNRMCLTRPWARLLCDECVVAYSLRPRSWLDRHVRRSFEGAARFRSTDVVRCQGTLGRFTLSLRGASITFGLGVDIDFVPTAVM
jgi:hypothetical protein